MTRTVVLKLLQILPVLFLVSLGSFFMLELVPGDPAVAVLGADRSPEEYEEVRQYLGLNDPLPERYATWIGGAITGDLGQSVYSPHRDVVELIAQRLPVTVEVALLSMLLSLAIAVPVAMVSAYRPGRAPDRVATGVAFGALSIPAFLAGLLVVFFFVFHPDIVKRTIVALGVGVAAYVIASGWRGVRAIVELQEKRRGIFRIVLHVFIVLTATFVAVRFFPDFPRQGFARISDAGLRENLKSVALPVLTLAIAECAVFIRLLRSDLIETLGEDYILAARAKGMPPRRIMLGDALRPSLFSTVTIISVSLGRLIGGAVIVEIIFNLPGMGRLIVDSIASKDYPIVQGAVLMIAVVYVLSSVAVDIAYAYLDPRIRRGRV